MALAIGYTDMECDRFFGQTRALRDYIPVCQAKRDEPRPRQSIDIQAGEVKE
jgi:hypothetical protein